MVNNNSLIRQFLGDPNYRVMEDGTIWSGARHGWRQISVAPRHKGYCYLTYKGKSIKVHRIVYEKFVGPLIDGLVIDHINNIRHDNRPENLQQVTSRVNSSKDIIKAVRGPKKQKSPETLAAVAALLADPLYSIREDGSVWRFLRDKRSMVGVGWKQTGFALVRGHPIIRYKRRNIYVHDLVYAKFVGPLDPELVIDHLNRDPTDNRPVNLDQKTWAGNARNRSTTRYSVEVVEEVRVLYAAGWTQKAIIEKMELNSNQVSSMVWGQRWNEVD